jgi:hypothetical protein
MAALSTAFGCPVTAVAVEPSTQGLLVKYRLTIKATLVVPVSTGTRNVSVFDSEGKPGTDSVPVTEPSISELGCGSRYWMVTRKLQTKPAGSWPQPVLLGSIQLRLTLVTVNGGGVQIRPKATVALSV